MQVLHSPMQICGLMTTFAKALRGVGIGAKTISLLPHTYEEADEEVNINLYTREEKGKIRQRLFDENKDFFDVFHYYFGHTLLYDQADLPYLSRKNKKLFMYHNGSDVRLPSVARHFNPYINEIYSVDRKEEDLVRYIKNCAEWIPVAIVQDIELAQYVKPYYQKIEIVPLPLDLTLPIYRNFSSEIEYRNTKKIRILHAPTDRRIKGTQYIIDAIEKLKAKGLDLEFVIIEKMSHSNLLKEIAKADIIVDQLLLGTYGVLALEAMALGKPVICYIADFVREGFPVELPIVSATPETIFDVLTEMIEGKERLQVLGCEGRKYVETYHDLSTKILPQLLSIYGVEEIDGK